MLRKRQHPSPPFDEIDPAFHSVYDKKLLGEKLKKELDLRHLLKHVHTLARDLIIKYWLVLADKGPFLPVKDYECIIDTGAA